jgi:hypothetical protein
MAIITADHEEKPKAVQEYHIDSRRSQSWSCFRSRAFVYKWELQAVGKELKQINPFPLIQSFKSKLYNRSISNTFNTLST